MNLADPELELIDPTPNIHSLFVHFDDVFFYTKLKGRALVRWSTKMYSCAGVCSYEGRGGLCNIALSEPLLKLRPRKDLVETLLHEMIHAFLFITNRDNDRDGHGPNFKAHMYRINQAAGLNISIYHDFHDEVELYLKHWWRCNGRCQTMKPYFGVVRRSTNSAPGPRDYWWARHIKMCGGTFIKIQEPEKKQRPTKKGKGKINADITKYINNNVENTMNKNTQKVINKENKATSNINVNIVVPQLPIKYPVQSPEKKNLPDFGRRRTNSNSVVEKVRDVWLKKQIPSLTTTKTQVPVKAANKQNTTKHKVSAVHDESPPKKIKKIDDYFKSTATSILKDVYGKEFIISQTSNSAKLKAVAVKSDMDKVGPVNVVDSFVNCPSCNTKVNSHCINGHLDECLNKDIIEKLSKDLVQTAPITPIIDLVGNVHQDSLFKPKAESQAKIENDNMMNELKQLVGDIRSIPPFNTKAENNVSIKTEGSKALTCNDRYQINRTSSNPHHTDVYTRPNTSKDSLAQICHSCGNRVDIPMNLHLDDCLGFFDNNTTIPEEVGSGTDPNYNDVKIKTEPSSSQEDIVQKCPCCGIKVDKPIELHLDECIGFFNNNTTVPIEGASAIETIVIEDDDDMFDETQTFNATGTKSPCPCCLKMIEVADMNGHLDVCLSISLSQNF